MAAHFCEFEQLEVPAVCAGPGCWLLVMVSGDLYFLITMWPRLRPGSYVMGPTHDLQHQQQQQQTRQDAEIHHTIQPPTARYNNASHNNSTTQHQLLLSDPGLVRCSVLAACRSSQQCSAFRPPPSPAWHILQVSTGRIFYKYFTQQNIYTFR